MVNNIKSEWFNIKTGLPQGSLLSPILFNLFMSDLPHFIKNSSVNQFADDTNLTMNEHLASNYLPKLQKDLDEFSQWSYVISFL